MTSIISFKLTASLLFSLVSFTLPALTSVANAEQNPEQGQIQTQETQTESEVLQTVKEGVKLHDVGEYQKAVDIYLAGIQKYPDAAYLHYEIAYSYYRLNQLDKVIYHADIVIKNNEELLLEAFSIKSSALDAKGELAASIETFNIAIANFPNNYLLRFNLGVTLFRTGDLTKAEASFIQAIQLNPSHAGSHYLLAYLNEQTNNSVKAILSYYFFLMLEPSSERSKVAIANLIQLHQQSVQKKESGDVNININSDNLNNGLGTIELAIALKAASANLGPVMSEDASFISATESLFGIFSESEIADDNFWLEFYANFFAKLHKAGHTSAFTHHVYQAKSQESTNWLENNKADFEALLAWLEQ